MLLLFLLGEGYGTVPNVSKMTPSVQTAHYTVKRLGNIFFKNIAERCANSQPNHLLGNILPSGIGKRKYPTSHVHIVVSYFNQNLGKDMTLQLPDYGSPLVGKILTNCWAKYEKYLPNRWLGWTIGTTLENIAQPFHSVHLLHIRKCLISTALLPTLLTLRQLFKAEFAHSVFGFGYEISFTWRVKDHASRWRSPPSAHYDSCAAGIRRLKMMI